MTVFVSSGRESGVRAHHDNRQIGLREGKGGEEVNLLSLHSLPSPSDSLGAAEGNPDRRLEFASSC